MKYVLFTLDCELAWGFADLSPPVERIELMRENPTALRDVYRKLVDLFDEYAVPATWAFVGHLFYNSCSDGSHSTNELTGGVDPHTNRQTDPLYYGPDLVEMVLQADVDHDIGGHSFTHPEFIELDEPTVRTDLTAMLDAADEYGVDVSSFVFPRNSVAHTDVLEELGISTYRTGTVGTNYILRDGVKPFLFQDELFWSVPPVSPKRTTEGLVRIQASRLLHEVRWCYLHPWRLKRTLQTMDDGQVAHFAFHPHDLLGYYRLDWVLDRVLGVVEEFRARNDVEAITMADLPELV
jgi:peptidoglycan/xylan/chitin deacetylase (PgdA/CDA1 family)